MNVRFYTKLASRIGLVLGMLAAISCFFPPFLFYGMIGSIVGTLLSVSVIFVRTRYEVPTRWNHISYISIFLCSFPVIYVLVILFIMPRQ